MRKVIFLLTLLATSAAVASGLLPETSAVVINEEEKEGAIGIKNTQDKPVLLYAKINRLPDEDLAAVLLPVPAVVLVQPGETQVVRVLYRNNQPLDKEHLARVVFTGVPSQEESRGSRISFIIGQDLPVVIRPKNYQPVEDKWQYLKWTIEGRKLCVANDTKRVIRYANSVVMQPGNSGVTMPKTYSLPGTKQCAALPEGYHPAAVNQVKFSAVTDYNYLRDALTLPVTQGNGG